MLIDYLLKTSRINKNFTKVNSLIKHTNFTFNKGSLM